MSIVNLWFYNPKKETITGCNIINKIVSYVDGPFCHVELEFVGKESISIVMNSKVLFRHRSFDSDYYTMLPLKVEHEKEKRAYNIALRHFAAGTMFGIFSQHKTYCSKLIADILIEAQIVPMTFFPQSFLLSPSCIFKTFKKHELVINSNKVKTIAPIGFK